MRITHLYLLKFSLLPSYYFIFDLVRLFQYFLLGIKLRCTYHLLDCSVDKNFHRVLKLDLLLLFVCFQHLRGVCSGVSISFLNYSFVPSAIFLIL